MAKILRIPGKAEFEAIRKHQLEGWDVVMVGDQLTMMGKPWLPRDEDGRIIVETLFVFQDGTSKLEVRYRS